MHYPKLPNRKSFLDKGYTSIQMREYAQKCVESALRQNGVKDIENIKFFESMNYEVGNDKEFVFAAKELLKRTTDLSPNMMQYIAYNLAKRVKKFNWVPVTNDEVIALIPDREIDLSALILLGKRVNDLCKEKNSL